MNGKDPTFVRRPFEKFVDWQQCTAVGGG